MAQAVYTDDTQAAIARRLAATKAAAQATVARTAGPTTAGISVNELGTAPTAITPADLANRAAQLRAQAPGAGIGSDVPAYARRTPGINVGEVNPATLNPTEAASFARQGYVAPAPAPAVAPAATPAPAATAAAPVAAEAAAAPGIAARAGALGMRAIEAPFSPTGLAIAAGLSSVYGPNSSINRPTSDYANRFGEPVADNLPGEILQRTAGVATDAAANIGDLALLPVNAVRSRFGASPLQSFTSMLESRDNPATAQQARIDASAQNGANITAQPPTNAGFSNVETGATSTTPLTSVQPSVATLPGARSDAGVPLPGKVVNGVRTFSDGSGDPNAPGYVPRTLSTQDIAGLAHGNRISVADAGIGGNIQSEAAGRTLNLGEGPTIGGGGAGFTPAQRQAQLDSINERGRTADFNRLMAKSESELSRGSRKTAALLADLAKQARGPEAAPQTAAETAATAAKAQASIAEAGNFNAEAKRKNASNSILDQLNGETDPGKRQDLLDTLLASEGKNSGRVVTLKVPTGAVDAIGNPVMNELPFDTRSRQFLYDPRQPQQSPSIGR